MSDNTPKTRPCHSCGGRGVTVEDTSSDGVARQHSKTCTACNGSGQVPA